MNKVVLELLLDDSLMVVKDPMGNISIEQPIIGVDITAAANEDDIEEAYKDTSFIVVPKHTMFQLLRRERELREGISEEADKELSDKFPNDPAIYYMLGVLKHDVYVGKT